MNLEKYPILLKYFNDIENKQKFILNVMSINEDKSNSNTIHITDYEVTTKISYHYLNHNIPISRNSNTLSIKTNYASYVYDLTIYILLGLNNYQYYSHGEFIIENDIIYELINELTIFVQNACDKNKFDDPLENLKHIIKEIILTEKIEKIENIYDEKDMFSDKIENSDKTNHNINKNVLIA